MKKLRITIFAAMLPLLLLSCDDPLSVNLFSLQDDVNLGQQLDTEIRSMPQEYPLFNSQPANEYLQHIVNKILESPLIKYKNVFGYKVQIIDQPDIVNAFATPGAYIYVYTGLLKFLDNEAAIAGVLGHEIAHAEERHATERMTKAYGIQIMLSIALGDDPSTLEEISANLLTGLALLANSRADELESDELSFKFLEVTEYYPGGIRNFFEKIMDNSESGFLEELLSTHPNPEDRLNQVLQMLQDEGYGEPDESELFTQRYQNFLSLIP